MLKETDVQVVDLVILGKLTDGTIHQVIATEEQQREFLKLLAQTNENGKINVLADNIESVSWDSKFDLTK